MQRKIRGVCLFMIPVLIGVGVSFSGISNGPVFWSCMALSVVLAVIVLISFFWKSLEIHRAFYGSEVGGQDQTLTVREQVHSDRASFVVGTELFGDPRPNEHKRLTVEFSWRGRRQTKIVPQDHWCNLP